MDPTYDCVNHAVCKTVKSTAMAASKAKAAKTTSNRKRKYWGPSERDLNISRHRKLHDICAVVSDRRARGVEGWNDGVPDEIKLDLVVTVARLLAFVVPAGELVAEIDAAGEKLTDRGWMDVEFWGRGHHVEILEAARATAADPTYDVRADPWKRQILELLKPTDDEMTRLRLRTLRTEAVRLKMVRRASGSVDRATYLSAKHQAADQAAEYRRSTGVSERTDRRRRRVAEEKARMTNTDVNTAKLSMRGLRDVLDFMQLFFHTDDDVLWRLSQGPIPEIAGQPESLGDTSIVDHLARRAVAIKSFKLGRVALYLARIHGAGIADEASEDMLSYVLVYAPHYLQWSHDHDTSERLYPVRDLFSLAAKHPQVRDFHREIGKLLDGPAPTPFDGAEGEDTETGGFPGVEQAGCSQATFYRRKRAAALVREAEAKRLADELAAAEEEARATRKRALW